MPSRPPPTPKGVAGVPKVGSGVPNAAAIGEPTSSPCEPLAPMGLQSTPVVKPACSQVLGMIVLKAVPSPGNDNKVFAMLFGAPCFRNCGVSAKVLLVETELLRS